MIKTSIISTIPLFLSATGNIIYLDWFAQDLQNDKLFDLVDGGKEWQLLRERLRKQGYDITTYRYNNKKNDIFYGTQFDIPTNHAKLSDLYGTNRCALFLWEPPSVKPANFDKNLHKDINLIFTWADDLVDNKKYFKFFYPQPNSTPLEKIPYEKKKFCCTLIANKRSNHPQELYSERLKTVIFFEKNAPDLLDLYGPGWERQNFSCYKGFVPDKLQTLAHYKFSLCYENIRDIAGYVSEKIHHCLLAGCVPIYWGASNITDYIPAECFIDRRKFSSNKELFKFLISKSRTEYEAYLEAAQQYLISPKQMLFSNLYFVDCLLKGFIPDYKQENFFSEKERDLLKNIHIEQEKIIQKEKIKKSFA